MKLFIATTIASAFILFSCNGADKTEGNEDNTADSTAQIEFTDFNQKISYAIGLDHGSGCRTVYASPETKDKFILAEVKRGLMGYLADEPLDIAPEMIDSILGLYLQKGGMVDSSQVSKQKASYAIGIGEGQFLVSSLVGRGIDQKIDIPSLNAGIKDGINNQFPNLTVEEARGAVTAYYADINKVLGADFLAENEKKDSVQTTESGLQYQVLREGTGKSPNLTDSCIVHYTGRFIDGRVFESTIPSQRPAQFTPMGVIRGWQEGLQLMKEGGKTRFFIPYELAYGDRGSGPIEPFSALVFDIELIKVVRFK
jgi:FKBP-type peptidyl-prolyl cis-trans isomerase FklB